MPVSKSRRKKSKKKTPRSAVPKTPALSLPETGSVVLEDRPGAFRITCHRADPDKRKDAVLITFSRQQDGLSDTGFGVSFGLAHGYDTIHVAQEHETHFQNLPAKDFRSIVTPALQGRRSIAYGSELGGYAALYYGSMLRSDIVAGSPLLPSWPGLKDPRYSDVTLHHTPLKPRTADRGRVTILFDPAQRKGNPYLEEVVRPAYPDATYVELPHAGAAVFTTLQKAGLLTQILLALFEGDALPAFEMPTEGFVPWHLNLGQERLAARNYAEAERHGRAALAQQTSGAAVSLVARSLVATEAGAALEHFLTQDLTPEEFERFIVNSAGLRRVIETSYPDLLAGR